MKIKTYDQVFLDLMKKKKYRDIFGRYYKDLNVLDIIRDFLIDMELIKDFKEYCKMRFEIKKAEGKY